MNNESSSSSVEATETGVEIHGAALARLTLRPTPDELDSLSAIWTAHREALMSDDDAGALAVEQDRSDVMARIAFRLASESLAVAQSGGPESDAMITCSAWLAHVAEFGFPSNEERLEFKNLIGL